MEEFQTTSISASTLLSEIQLLVQKNCTADALERAQLLTASLPKNIFVAGLQKQIEKLHTAKNTDGNASALRSSLQPLIDKAIESTSGAPNQSVKSPTTKPAAKSDKAKAIDGLKAQYFAHADNFMKKGDYHNALAEVRRILLLDASDVTAHAYIERLEELLLLEKEKDAHQPSPTASRKADEPTEKKFAPSASLNDLVTMTQPDFDSIVAKNSGSGGFHLSLNPTPATKSVEKRNAEQKRKSSTPFLIGSAFLIILAILASYIITSTPQPEVATAEQKSAQKLAGTPPLRNAGARNAKEIHVGTQAPSATTDSLHSTN